jgi:hypothetical protein
LPNDELENNNRPGTADYGHQSILHSHKRSGSYTLIHEIRYSSMDSGRSLLCGEGGNSEESVILAFQKARTSTFVEKRGITPLADSFFIV